MAENCKELIAPNERIGHFIRLALSLSILKGIPINIKDIRINAENKGLNKSDIMYIKILAQISNAKTKNVEKGNTSFYFEPVSVKETPIIINLTYPAIVPLLTIFLMLIFYNKNNKIRVNGPTNREDKITIDYLRLITIPLLDKMNIKQRIEICKRGYFQDNGGVILNTKHTKEITGLDITNSGELEKITAYVHSYGHNESVNNYMIEGAQKRLKQDSLKIDKLDNIFLENREKYKGYGIDLVAQFENSLVGANYTSIKKQASQVGKECADRLLGTINKNIPLDKHSSNLLIPFLALAKSESRIKIGKKDEFVDIACQLCTTFLGTTFDFDVQENYTIITITPKIE